ncbi:MAG TPA: type III pantothenate kinase [Virgibacillus sp.]|nr:type III pantothenate kinase [Virgibacillus sp.]
MIFVVDVGNTNTVLGIFSDNELTHEWRIRTDRHKTEDELGMLIRSLLHHKGLTFSDMSGVIISSVVPPIMFALEKMSQDYFNLDPLIIGKKTVHTYLSMTYPHPEEIGADRIVNAVGAIKEYGSPLIIVDFGTATTHCYINENSEYVGGSISPGIDISMEALYGKASKLPKIEMKRPDKVVGSSTIQAMQSGVVYGFVGQVDGIVRRMKGEAKQDATVIATGGLASLIANSSDTIDYADPYLTLKGLNEIYNRNIRPNG